MVQFSRPSADSSDGLWTDQAGGTVLFSVLDEAVADDADYIRSGTNPANDTVKIKLGSLTDPASSSGHVVRYRIGKTGTTQMNLTARLVQGTTVIAEWVHTDIAAGPTDVAQTLTAPQADAITDYTDLYIAFVANVAAGPGGIASTNVKLWLKADAITGLADGDAVATWADSGPLGKNATQATSGFRPIYKTAILNGKPSVRFDATNDVLLTPAIDLTDTASLMVFSVWKMTTTGGYRMVYESTAGDAETSVGTIQMYRRPSEDLRILHKGNGGAAPQRIDDTSVYTTTARYLTAIHDFSQATGTGEIALRRNGVDITGAVVNGSTNNTDTGFGNHTLSVGNRGDGSFSAVEMDLFELIILKGKDTTERNAVESYLAAKYGL